MRGTGAVRLGVVLATALTVALALTFAAIAADKPVTVAGPGGAAPPSQQATGRPAAQVLIVAPPRAAGGLSGKVPFRAKVVSHRVISRLEFRIDGRWVWTDRSAPYQFKGPKGRWNTKTVKQGRHRLFVVAYDRRGRRVGAALRVVRVVRGPKLGPASGGRSPRSAGIPSPYAPPEIDGPASVFVASNGSDAAACTAAAPCRSFQRAYRQAQPGQIVEVAGGTYPAQTIPEDPSKTAASYVIIRPRAGDSVQLASTDPSQDDLSVYGRYVEVRDMALSDAWYVHPGADNAVLRRLDVKRFFVTSASNIFVVGGDIGPLHNSASQIKPLSESAPKPRNVVVDGAYFHDYTRDPGAHMECLQAWSVEGFVLRNSTFTRCAVFNVFVGELFQEVTNNALIENNFFDEILPGGGQSVLLHATNTVFRYNSVLGSVYVDPATSSNVRLTANVGHLAGGSCSPGVIHEYNVWSGTKCSPTDLNAGAGFVRPVDGDMDLHIGPGSAAVGHGKPGDFPPTDIDGQTRPIGGAPDAGADER